jgi:hypothetical protein
MLKGRMYCMKPGTFSDGKAAESLYVVEDEAGKNWIYCEAVILDSLW